MAVLSGVLNIATLCFLIISDPVNKLFATSVYIVPPVTTVNKTIIELRTWIHVSDRMLRERSREFVRDFVRGSKDVLAISMLKGGQHLEVIVGSPPWLRVSFCNACTSYSITERHFPHSDVLGQLSQNLTLWTYQVL